jgi:hypothetical protein
MDFTLPALKREFQLSGWLSNEFHHPGIAVEWIPFSLAEESISLPWALRSGFHHPSLAMEWIRSSLR